MLRTTQVVALLLALVSPAWAAQESEKVDYLKQVKPILARRCFMCHGNLKQARGFGWTHPR